MSPLFIESLDRRVLLSTTFVPQANFVSIAAPGGSPASAVAPLAGGNFAVLYVDNGALYVKVVNGAAGTVGAATKLSPDGQAVAVQGGLGLIDAASDAQGRVVCAYIASDGSNGYDPYYCRLDSTGAIDIAPTLASDPNDYDVQIYPTCSVQPNGNFAVGWCDETATISSAQAVEVRTFDSSGNPTSADQLVSTALASGQRAYVIHPTLCPLSTGNYLCIWDTQYLVGQTADVQSQEIDAAVVPASGTPGSVTTIADVAVGDEMGYPVFCENPDHGGHDFGGALFESVQTFDGGHTFINTVDGEYEILGDGTRVLQPPHPPVSEDLNTLSNQVVISSAALDPDGHTVDVCYSDGSRGVSYPYYYPSGCFVQNCSFDGTVNGSSLSLGFISGCVAPEIVLDADGNAFVLAPPSSVGGAVKGKYLARQAVVPPVVSIAAAGTYAVDGSGNRSITFTATLSKPLPNGATVSASTSDLSAVAGVDYVAITNGTISFGPNETTATITVSLIGKAADAVKKFSLTISNPSSDATLDIYNAVSIGTVVATSPVVSIADGEYATDILGNRSIKFFATLSKTSSDTVTVSASTADGSAIAGTDYSAVTNATLTFPPGETTASVTVALIGKTAAEAKTFSVTISNPANATLNPLKSQATGTLVITNNIYAVTGSLSFKETSTSAPGTKLSGTVNLDPEDATTKVAGKGTLTGELVPVGGGDSIPLGSLPVSVNVSKGKAQAVRTSFPVPSSVPFGEYNFYILFAPGTGIDASKVDPAIVSTAAGNTPVVTVKDVFGKGILRTIPASDADGTHALISLSGPGTAELVHNGDGTLDLALTGTTAKTNISFKLLAPGADGAFTIRNITSDGPIGKLTGPVDVTGNIALPGGAAGLALHNLKDGHTVTLSGSTAPTAISFAHVANASITSSQPIKSLTVADWLDTGDSANIITAPAIATLTSAGNFQADLALSGALGTAKVTGNFDADILAASIGKFAVSGTLGSPGASRDAIRTSGTLGAITAGSATNLILFSGLASDFGALPGTASLFGGSSSLLSLTVTGTFSNTLVAAKALGTIKLATVTTANADPFGIAGATLKSYARGTRKASKVTAPSTVDSADQFSVATVG